MKLFTITKETQGIRANDFCWADDGELAVFGSQCSRGSVDDKCGCRRSMSGLDSSKASTTVKVVDLKLDLEGLTIKLADHYEKNWGMNSQEALDIAKEEAEELRRNANFFTAGSVLEIRGNKLVKRGL